MVGPNKKVILTVPSEKIVDAVLGCGSTTGRNTDKTVKFGIKMQELPDSDIIIPAQQ